MKKIIVLLIKAVVVAFSLVVVFLSLLPISHGIINIGNIFGIIYFGTLSVLLPTTSFWFPTLKKLCKKTATKTAVIIFSAAICLGTLYMIVISGFMIGAALTEPAEDATVIVLGCQVNGESPSLMLTKRLEAACEYLEAHPNADCVLSGGQGNNEDISEAECMYRYLTAHGIEADRLYKEEQSTTTLENISFSMQIIKDRGLNENLAIVTDGFHEFRAFIIAGDLGYSCGAVPASTPAYLFLTFTFREMFALAKEIVF